MNTGYYWVKVKDTNIYQIAEFTIGNTWLLIGTDTDYSQEDFISIGPKLLEPCNNCGAIGFPSDYSTRASGEIYRGCAFCVGKA